MMRKTLERGITLTTSGTPDTVRRWMMRKTLERGITLTTEAVFAG